ncbi:hypothetical protein [Haliscomenobacter sp.]|uniref:hypothetical protein n=1 Tax=Haliscomenobacter sp. TaxID=2717303 RepID=UPI0035933224
MKFWELISAFRSEKDIVEIILGKPQWKEYGGYFQNFSSLVKEQNRAILDQQLPYELITEVYQMSKLKFYLYGTNLRSTKLLGDDNFEELSSLEVFLKYGGACIEEVLEKGSLDMDRINLSLNLGAILDEDDEMLGRLAQ